MPNSQKQSGMLAPDHFMHLLSGNRSGIRTAIFFLIQPFILIKSWLTSPYAIPAIILLTFLSLLTCISHIYVMRQEHPGESVSRVIMRHCKISIYFCLIMCIICAFICWNYN